MNLNVANILRYKVYKMLSLTPCIYGGTTVRDDPDTGGIVYAETDFTNMTDLDSHFKSHTYEGVSTTIFDNNPEVEAGRKRIMFMFDMQVIMRDIGRNVVKNMNKCDTSPDGKPAVHSWGNDYFTLSPMVNMPIKALEQVLSFHAGHNWVDGVTISYPDTGACKVTFASK